MDGRCHSLTASHVRERHRNDDQVPVCDFFEKFDACGKEIRLPVDVYSLEDLKKFGKEHGICPYYLARYTVSYPYFFLSPSK